jgi:hypothetical protein
LKIIYILLKCLKRTELDIDEMDVELAIKELKKLQGTGDRWATSGNI